MEHVKFATNHYVHVRERHLLVSTGVCLQCILYENLCIGELWKILGVCKIGTGKYDVYRMCPGKTQTLGTDNVMVLVRLLLLLHQENILSLLEGISQLVHYLFWKD